MRIALTGASGFIGTSIQQTLLNDRAEFFVLKREASDQEWKTILEHSDVIINLAGAPVIQRWTSRAKAMIKSSRVSTTQRLVSLLNAMPSEKCPHTLISASAIGIYPDDGLEKVDELTERYGTGFLSDVVKSWEHEALRLKNGVTRLAIIRIGIVLGKNGGLLKKILALFRMGLGGRIVSGRQIMSFIHIDDLIAAIQFIIEQNTISGTFNLVAPHNVNNKEFTHTMGKILRRPTFIPVPSLALRLLYGKAADIMIKGENVYPLNLLNSGFDFNFPTLEKSLEDLLLD
jgi:uncharacterized protein (TIGR01777 family)